MSTLTHCKISEKTQVLALRGRPPLPSSSSTTLYAPPPTIVRASGHTPLLVPVGALPLEGCGGGSKKPPWPPLTYSTISCPLSNVTSCLSSVCLHRTYHNLTCWGFFPSVLSLISWVSVVSLPPECRAFCVLFLSVSPALKVGFTPGW